MPATSDSRVIKAVGLGLILTSAAMLVTSVGIGIAQSDSGPGPEFVTAEDGQFWLNGEPFAYASTNNYTLMYSPPPTIDAFMVTMQQVDLPVLRAWASFEIGNPDGTGGVEISNKGAWFQYWDEEAGRPAINEGENGLQMLDYMVASAAEHDIKLVLPLVNNWTAFGGMDQYVRWAGGEYHDDFLTNETIKGWYKDWVSTLLNRVNTVTGVAYKDDPTIMAWELANEMRCSETGPYPSGPGCTSENMVAWADEMSTYIKSIDSNHLIGFGAEGFLCTEPGGSDWLTNCTESADPAAITNLPNIDMNGIHVYPNHWQPTEPTDDWEEWSVWFIQQHGAIANEAGKPFYIGEYGWLDQEHRGIVFDHWLEEFQAVGGDGSHFWIMHPESSIAAPPDSVGFTQRCPGPACSVVTNWNQHMRDGAAWDTFAPVAETDLASTNHGVPVTLSVLENDIAWGDATLDAATIDLDPLTDGVQSTWEHKRGTFTAQGDTVTFAPLPDATGSSRVSYTVTDSAGKVSNEAYISVSLLTADDEAETESAEAPEGELAEAG